MPKIQQGKYYFAFLPKAEGKIIDKKIPPSYLPAEFYL